MANKIVAVFLMCIVLAATVSVEARNYPEEILKLRSILSVRTPKMSYKGCFSSCLMKCPKLEGQYTDCEMKCDEKCTAEEFAAKLHIL